VVSAGRAHSKLIVDEALPCVEPQDAEPAQIAPSTSMKVPAGMLMVVPALMMSFAPSATVTSPVSVCVPLQVSVVMISPAEVSLTALAAGTVTNPINRDVRRSPTSPTLFPTFAIRMFIPL